MARPTSRRAYVKAWRNTGFRSARKSVEDHFKGVGLLLLVFLAAPFAVPHVPKAWLASGGVLYDIGRDIWATLIIEVMILVAAIVVALLWGFLRAPYRLHRELTEDLNRVEAEVAKLRHAQAPTRVDVHHYIEFPAKGFFKGLMTRIVRAAPISGGRATPGQQGITMADASDVTSANNVLEPPSETGE